MEKKKEKKLIEVINTLIGSDKKESDEMLITDFIDWIKISEKSKEELQRQVQDGDSMNWQTLATIAMALKQIQNIMQRLNITPEKRSRKKNNGDDKPAFDLEKVTKDN
jgi:hypothetical protein